jgi:NAD(P)-dependent dehydrogenase (short-subunit alcohol dehydrogenase family)
MPLNGRRYDYVTHLILNAGWAAFLGVDWLGCCKQFVRDGTEALARPTFKKQSISPVSADGLGAVWQGNIFGHFVMTRRLHHLLLRCPYPEARVLWTSSIQAERALVGSDILEDWQLKRTLVAYEASKYQADLIAANLDRREAIHRKLQGFIDAAEIRHLLVHPGISSSNIFAVIGWFLLQMMSLAFLMVRPVIHSSSFVFKLLCQGAPAWLISPHSDELERCSVWLPHFSDCDRQSAKGVETVVRYCSQVWFSSNEIRESIRRSR